MERDVKLTNKIDVNYPLFLCADYNRKWCLPSSYFKIKYLHKTFKENELRRTEQKVEDGVELKLMHNLRRKLLLLLNVYWQDN